MGARGRRLKRAVDVAAAAAALVLAAPVIAVVALAVRATMGRPVLFAQERPGLHGRPFRLYKFRTMSEDRDERGALLPEEARVTPLGRLLRATSLDELPELYHVLRGDMSLVGPRPLLLEYLGRYTPEQARRHEVRPGITGLAQVRGRNGLDWERRFELDVWYVDNWSLWLDARVLARTLWAVLAREGISQEGLVGVEEYRGAPPGRADVGPRTGPPPG